MERLGFGTHLVIDGYQSRAERLSDDAVLRSLLEELAKQLEPEANVSAVLKQGEDQGISAAVVLAESYATIHTFPKRQCWSFQLFSRKDLEFSDISQKVREALKPGRIESHLSSRAKVMPRQKLELKRNLLGDRDYADVRLDESLLTTGLKPVNS